MMPSGVLANGMYKMGNPFERLPPDLRVRTENKVATITRESRAMRRHVLAQDSGDFRFHPFRSKMLGESVDAMGIGLLVNRYRVVYSRGGEYTQRMVCAVAILSWDIIQYRTADVILIRAKDKLILLCEIKSSDNSANSAAHRGTQKQQRIYQKALQERYPDYKIYCCLLEVDTKKSRGFREDVKVSKQKDGEGDKYDFVFSGHAMWALLGNDKGTYDAIMKLIPDPTPDENPTDLCLTLEKGRMDRIKEVAVRNSVIQWDHLMTVGNRGAALDKDWDRMLALGLVTNDFVPPGEIPKSITEWWAEYIPEQPLPPQIKEVSVQSKKTSKKGSPKWVPPVMDTLEMFGGEKD